MAAKKDSYSKRPIWQWVVIYLVVGVLIYGAIYYFWIGKDGGYNSSESIPYYSK